MPWKAYSTRTHRPPRGEAFDPASCRNVRPTITSHVNSPPNLTFQVIDVPGDGNCFYYAFATAVHKRQLNDKEMKHYMKQYRKIAWDAATQAPGGRSQFMTDDNMNKRQFLKSGCWAYEPQIIALAQASFARLVSIKVLPEVFDMLTNEMNDTYELVTSDDFLQNKWVHNITVYGEEGLPIYLLNKNDTHFAALVLVS